MENFNPKFLKQLYIPSPSSHKGQNGKVLVIGGSHLFHSSAFWALEVATKIVDMVYFSSTPINNEIVAKLKTKFVNGIIVPRDKADDYIEEADCILIGPGLPRPDGEEIGDDSTKILTERLFLKFPHKKWVVDGGSLQVIEPGVLPKASIITPNTKEFEILFGQRVKNQELEVKKQLAFSMAKRFGITILLKGVVDAVCNQSKCLRIEGGNAGMTKGGTGDVLAGLAAAFYAKNEALLSASCASFINKKAGESLYKRVGLYFNASDLLGEIPKVMKELI